MRGDLSKPYNGSSLFLAIDVGHFRPIEQFAADVQAGAERVRHSKRAPGTDRLYTPGERAWESQRSAETVRIEASVLSALNNMAGRLGVPPLSG
jgi:LDH2 family malate/lactate/ureidoglycolate dehydrogenase